MDDRSESEIQSRKFHLFLSPHFDDAVLSCGGQIAQLTAQGHTVVVYTVMAGRPPRDLPDSPILRDLHDRWKAVGDPVVARRYEDMNAVRMLGAVARHDTISDCVYRIRYGPGGVRQALYPTEESLWGPVHPADTAVLLLSAALLPYDGVHVLHVPLGAGGHVDHRLVRDWGRRLARIYPDLTVLYYEEYPYNTDSAAVQTALAAFAPEVLTPRDHLLSESALRVKIAAIGCYKSQISTFWQDTVDMARAVREDALRAGGGQPAEREWRVRSGDGDATEEN